jgi:hypothetical protein
VGHAVTFLRLLCFLFFTILGFCNFTNKLSKNAKFIFYMNLCKPVVAIKIEVSVLAHSK